MSSHLVIESLFCGKPENRLMFIAPGSAPDIRPTQREFWFTWICHGKKTYRIQDTVYRVQAGDIILFQPESLITAIADPIAPAMEHYFAFGVKSFPSDWPAPSTWPVVRHMSGNDIIRPLFSHIISNAPSNYLLGSVGQLPVAIECAVETLLATFVFGPLERSEPAVSPRPVPVQRVLAWLDQLMYHNSTHGATLDDLAAVAGVSKRHLSRLFRESVGWAPLELLYLYRVTKSLVNLRSGEKIEAIAQELGFASAAHYIRRFERLFGKSPSKMREAMAKGYTPRLPRLPGL